jgi:Uma2 family endonuclease
MTTHPKPQRFTADAFIAWAMEQPRGRFELSGGEIVAMAPERVGHARVKLAVVNALAQGLRKRGLPCEAMTDGMSVRIDEATVYEPDALVRCGPRTPDDSVHIPDPLIVVEVVSPSSKGVDSGAKLVGYFKLPSVRHYLVLDTEARVVVHHRRGDDGGITTALRHDGALDLDPPGLSIDVRDVFASLD